MTSSRTSISALARGAEFPPVTFALNHQDVAAYLAATGDGTSYVDAIPPLAAVALGLAALQEYLSLPEGALHTGQEVEHIARLAVDDSIEFTGRIAQRSERQGFVISVVEFELSRGGSPCIHARTTIMAPAVTGSA